MKHTPLKKGFTTGTCAQAAAAAASHMLASKEIIKRIEVKIPSGIMLNLKLIDQKIGKNFASCAIIKDAGDDPDITDKVKIYAKVRFSKKTGITIKGADGIGRVTKPGLAVKVGEYAINPVPRQMIIKEIRRFLPYDIGIEVILSVPNGKKLSKQTFNPQLGIIGGISIIGTTGIVEPKSLDAYKASLALRLDVLRACGTKKVVLVLGYVGEKFCRQMLKISNDSIIKIGDHVGFMLKRCKQTGIKEVLLIGHIGKLIKLTCGQFNTHYQSGDNRLCRLADYAKDFGANQKTIKEIFSQTTAEGTIEILKKNKLIRVFKKIARDIVARLESLVDNKLKISCLILSLKGKVLGKCLNSI